MSAGPEYRLCLHSHELWHNSSATDLTLNPTGIRGFGITLHFPVSYRLPVFPVNNALFQTKLPVRNPPDSKLMTSGNQTG